MKPVCRTLSSEEGVSIGGPDSATAELQAAARMRRGRVMDPAPVARLIWKHWCRQQQHGRAAASLPVVSDFYTSQLLLVHCAESTS